MLSFGKEELSFEKGKTNDWVLANGIGGYASSTAIGLNTRKYHGLLIGSDENLNRTLYLSKLEETLLVGEEEFPLCVNQYKEGVVNPEGHKYIERFEFSDIVRYIYNAGGVRVDKTILVVHGENTVVVNYRIDTPAGLSVSLKLRPLVNIRDFHGNTHEMQDYAIRKIGNGFFVSRPKEFYMISDVAQYLEEPATYYDMFYEREKERGTGELDNHYSPGYFNLPEGKSEINIIASTHEINFERIKERLSAEAVRKSKMIGDYYKKTEIPKNNFATSLLLAADSFVVDCAGEKRIIAGYPWFSEWSRDSLVSLDGLLLSSCRNDDAREVLLGIARGMKNGAIENTAGSPELNADSPLLFINAAYHYVTKTQDTEFVKEKLWEKMKEALDAYISGNEYYEVGKEDLLVRTKKPGITWMDAKGSEGAFTPRMGKPVEINSLWFNAARIMAELSEVYEPGSKREYSALAEKIRGSFQKFYNPKKKALFDMIEPEDESTRPNQIFAVSLPFSPLSPEQQRSVFAKVFRRLYTPVGLRSLSPSSPEYREDYSGNLESRDAAYHNGTVWPYLLGAFFDGHSRVFRRIDASAIELIEPFEENLRKYGIGSVNEIFEAKTMRPDGCISQAWSVAEVLRIYTKVKTEGINWV